MVVLGMATERLVLRPLLGQNEETLLMATIGLAFIVEGLAQALWGVEVRRIELVQNMPIGWVADGWDIFISQFDMLAAIVAWTLLDVLALLFFCTQVGKDLRAVA